MGRSDCLGRMGGIPHGNVACGDRDQVYHRKYSYSKYDRSKVVQGLYIVVRCGYIIVDGWRLDVQCRVTSPPIMDICVAILGYGEEEGNKVAWPTHIWPTRSVRYPVWWPLVQSPNIDALNRVTGPQPEVPSQRHLQLGE